VVLGGLGDEVEVPDARVRWGGAQAAGAAVSSRADVCIRLGWWGV